MSLHVFKLCATCTQTVKNNTNTALSNAEYVITKLETERGTLQSNVEHLNDHAIEIEQLCQKHMEDKREYNAAIKGIKKVIWSSAAVCERLLYCTCRLCHDPVPRKTNVKKLVYYFTIISVIWTFCMSV